MNLIQLVIDSEKLPLPLPLRSRGMMSWPLHRLASASGLDDEGDGEGGVDGVD